MALDIKTMKRVFKHGKKELADPNIAMSPDDVMAFYSNTYPELTTSTVQGPKVMEDRIEYEFKTVVGTKG